MGDHHSYKNAGVNLDSAERFISYIRQRTRKQSDKRLLSGVGGFASLFDFSDLPFSDPVLVSATDGVGTKLMIAQAVAQHRTIGIDLVAMSVNDILTHGATPMFFLDYIATGRLEENALHDLIDGILLGCEQADLSLVGGETAEMPGFYPPKHYDLCGFALGVVSKRAIKPQAMSRGDIIVGFPSHGLHANGYSLVRQILEKEKIDITNGYFSSETRWSDILLAPTKIYTHDLLPYLEHLLGMAHITGGGIVGNLPRILPDTLTAKIDTHAWPVPEIFRWLQEHVSLQEMFRVFNMGIGMIAVISKESLIQLHKDTCKHGTPFFVIGHLTERGTSEQVVLEGL